VDEFRREHLAALPDLPERYVGAVDLRQADIFPVEVAQRLIGLLSEIAPLVERTGFLIGEGAVFALQIERILRNSAHPQRRAFREPEPLKNFLGEILTPLERARLAEFLGEGGGAPRTALPPARAGR